MIAILRRRSAVLCSGPGSRHGGVASGRLREQDVKRLQSQLQNLGCFSGEIGGNYGLTERAVRDFQSGHGLHVDGLAGPNTLTAIQRILCGGGGQRGKQHRVVRGYTLSAIARRYGTTVDAIYNANDIIVDRNLIQLIQPGWVLDIPSR